MSTAITITPEITFQRSKTILASTVGTEMVMMDIDVGRYYGFNAVGTHIWNLLETPCSVQSICEQLRQGFEVEPEACQQEVISFITQLLEFKLITQIDSSDS